MNKTIYKYPVEPGRTEIATHLRAEFIKFGLDPDGRLCVWAIVDKDRPEEWLNIEVVGTGQEVPDGKYIGSATVAPYVWHAFAL